MEKTRRPIPWLSGCLATFVALLITAVTLPNTGRVIVDHAFDPPRVFVQPQPMVVCYILAMTFIPVICIFILSPRWRFFEWFGWGVLALFILCMATM